MDSSLFLGMTIGFSGAAALAGVRNLTKQTNKLKAQLSQVEGSKKLISDLKQAQVQLALVKKLGASKELVVKDYLRVRELRNQLKSANVETKNLTQSLRTLNAQKVSLNLEQAGQYKQQMMGKAVNLAATGYTVSRPISAIAGLEDNAKDIAITGEFSAIQEAMLTQTIRSTALAMNQTTEAISGGLKELVAGGIQSAGELNQYAPVIAKTATATRAEMADISNTFLALSNNMKISAADSEAAMNIMVKSTKLGQVEFKDMSKWMPQLTPMLAALGMTGKESVAQLASMLQVAKMGAGTTDEAGNNLKNLLTKITAPDTVKDFEKVGIDLKESLKQSAANGIDPVTAMLGTVEKYMSTALTGKDLVTYQKAMAEKDDVKSAEMFKSLAEAGNMGQLFQDMQAMSALRAMLQNKDKLQQFSADSLAAGNTDMLGDDFNKRTQGLTEQWKSFGIAIDELNIGLGALFLEPLKDITRFVKELALGVGNFVKNNPALSKTIGYIAGAVAVFSALSVVVLGVGAVMSGLAAIASMAAIGFSLVTLPIALIIAGVAALAYGAYQLYQNFGQVRSLLTGFWDGFMVGFSPVIALFDGFGGKVASLIDSIFGIKIASDESSFAWQVWGENLGMVLGSSITAITDFIGNAIFWFWSLPNNIKLAFNGLTDWFSSLWQDLLSGLLSTVNFAKEAFNSLMPERFKIGIDPPKMPELTAPKVQGFDLPKMPSVKPLDVPEPSHFNSTRGNVIDQSTVNFTPSIVLPAGTPEQTVSSVKQALSISQTEFEQRYKQMQRNNQRLNFAGQ